MHMHPELAMDYVSLHAPQRLHEALQSGAPASYRLQGPRAAAHAAPTARGDPGVPVAAALAAPAARSWAGRGTPRHQEALRGRAAAVPAACSGPCRAPPARAGPRSAAGTTPSRPCRAPWPPPRRPALPGRAHAVCFLTAGVKRRQRSANGEAKLRTGRAPRASAAISSSLSCASSQRQCPQRRPGTQHYTGAQDLCTCS